MCVNWHGGSCLCCIPFILRNYPMISEYQLRLLPREAASEGGIISFLCREKGLEKTAVKAIRILRRSIDARQRTVYVNLKVCVYLNEFPTDDMVQRVNYPKVHAKPTVIVVGAGPGGLFAALRVIELGYRPIVLERGKNVRERKIDLADISRTHRVDADSNYCFGEGGAGAYSDGKLYTRSKKRGSVEKILHVFCQHGAEKAVLFDAHPHIGTDKLPQVIENMRNQIIESGGEVHFKTKMTALLRQGNRVIGVEAIDLPTDTECVFEGPVILATGHSARDVYRYVCSSGIAFEPKGIAMGVRLEHPVEIIDRIQYHSPEGRGKYLPAAEYSYVQQVEGRGVYSFCMCPGGFVIPSATETEQVVVNGMSPANRGTKWSNSGMVVEMRPEDIEGDDPLRVLKFQEELEHLCWLNGNRTQAAPAQRMADFVNGRLSFDLPRSSYAPGVVSSPLHFWMPSFITTRLQEGFKKMGKQSRGFLTNEAVMIGVETRTSSPIRILRDKETLQHVELEGLFPCGEGAGYAGGIVSAAIDGERCAEMCALYLSTKKSQQPV